MIDIIELEGKQDNLCRKLNKAKGKHCRLSFMFNTMKILSRIGFKAKKRIDEMPTLE